MPSAACRNRADTATITTVTIASGSSTASFLYNDTLAGSPTTAAVYHRPPTRPDPHPFPTRRSSDLNAAGAAKFVYTTAPQTLTAGVNSGTITVQLQDAFSNPVSAELGLNFINVETSYGGCILRNSADTATITTVTIASGSSTASFLYKDTVA